MNPVELLDQIRAMSLWELAGSILYTFVVVYACAFALLAIASIVFGKKKS